ncbi:MAG: hypothetical protein ABJB12_13125 [Pseudomonadota bacterium]
MTLADRVLRRSVPELVRVACVLALLALGLVCWSVLQPRPIPVILAMSAGHVIGGAAFACYLLAVILDAVQRPGPATENPVLSSGAQALVDSTKHKGSIASSSTTKS